MTMFCVYFKHQELVHNPFSAFALRANRALILLAACPDLVVYDTS